MARKKPLPDPRNLTKWGWVSNSGANYQRLREREEWA